MIMGIDHGYYAVKTRHFSFPAGVTAYTHEPYTLKNTLQIGGKYYLATLPTGLHCPTTGHPFQARRRTSRTRSAPFRAGLFYCA